jgi:glycosyltransferase involved in cell wall biosynthesis
VEPRILFFIPGLNVGGAERHTIGLREQLADRGIPSSLLVHGPRRSPAIVERSGAKGVVQLDIKGMSDLRGWFRVYRAIRQFSPEVIVAVNQTPLIVAVVVRLLGGTRARIACVFHTTILRESERKRFFLFRWAVNLADLLIYVSANQMAYWKDRKLKCKKQVVILNGIDFSYFNPSLAERVATRRQLGFDEADIVIGMVAAFRPEKKHEHLIEAIKALRDQGLPVKALLVGEGSTLAPTKALVDHLSIGEFVVFAGEHRDVRPYINACDAGILCSNAVETFSLSALEFLALGVPMLMSRIGGASEIVTDGVNGFLFDPDNVSDLTAKIRSIIDPALRARLAASARQSIKELSLDNMTRQYVEILAP